MLVSEFSESCTQYENFQVWEIDSIDSFFKGNQVLAKIFNDLYSIPLEELHEKRKEIADSDLGIMMKLLKEVDDKSFFVFTLHDQNHMELVGMQRLKVMNFGIDIEKIRHDRVYVMIMDKKTKGAFNFA